MASLQGQPGELAFKVQITRKETGKVEEYDLVGLITPEQAEQLGLTSQEQGNGSNSQHGGA
jgi:hypothetical protein